MTSNTRRSVSRSDLVETALVRHNCTQKALANMMGVSPTQISAWKKDGTHMSSEMEARLRELAFLEPQGSELEVWAGSAIDAEKWSRLFVFLGSNAEENGETGYRCDFLVEDEDDLAQSTVRMLVDLGISSPKPFPPSLETVIDFDPEDDGDVEDQEAAIRAEPLSNFVRLAYQAMTDVDGFYQAFVAAIVNNDDVGLDQSEVAEIEAQLLLLAASKTNLPSFATRANDAKFEVRKTFEKWLLSVKRAAIIAKFPLGAELMNLVTESHDALGHLAEAQSLGINDNRLHPDIYTNELLVGMRLLHQVLPVLLKKLDIPFVLEPNSLTVKL